MKTRLKGEAARDNQLPRRADDYSGYARLPGGCIALMILVVGHRRIYALCANESCINGFQNEPVEFAVSRGLQQAVQACSGVIAGKKGWTG